MRHRRAAVRLLPAAALLCLGAGCGVPAGSPSFPPPPRPLQASTTCRLDGMFLEGHPGPHAELIYRDGHTDFFCNPWELFDYYYSPDRPHQHGSVAALYVQNMGAARWANPQGHWILAQKAFFVVGDHRPTDMGYVFVPFATRSAAEAFARQWGGKVLSFSQITPAVVKAFPERSAQGKPGNMPGMTPGTGMEGGGRSMPGMSRGNHS
ncbi:MAG: nitrous oxide reductase accessory protein NosL [Firmicutes bacterium]|nr:nitrous oxide reductase accessory protein NosL [Bacillota bacterium]